MPTGCPASPAASSATSSDRARNPVPKKVPRPPFATRQPRCDSPVGPCVLRRSPALDVLALLGRSRAHGRNRRVCSAAYRRLLFWLSPASAGHRIAADSLLRLTAWIPAAKMCFATSEVTLLRWLHMLGNPQAPSWGFLFLRLPKYTRVSANHSISVVQRPHSRRLTMRPPVLRAIRGTGRPGRSRDSSPTSPSP